MKQIHWLLNESTHSDWFREIMHAAVKLESSAVVTIYIFSIISELNKEFPAISLVERFLI